MKNRDILLFEFKHCLSSNKFKIIFLCCTVISIGAFLINAKFYYGQNLTEVRSAFDVNIINGTRSSAIRMLIITLLPLMSLLLYSDSFLIDYNTGMYINIISRTSIKKYIFNKAVVVVAISFATFFYMLFLNELLCIITFPMNGIANNFSTPSFIKTYVPDAFLGLTKLKYPYLHDFIMILLYSSIASVHALLSFAISLVYKHKRVVFMIGYFLGVQVIDILFQASGVYKYHINYIVNSNSGSFITFAVWNIIVLIVSFILIIINKNSKEFSL